MASTVSKLTAPLQPFEEDNEQPQLPVAPIEVTGKENFMHSIQMPQPSEPMPLFSFKN